MIRSDKAKVLNKFRLHPKQIISDLKLESIISADTAGSAKFVSEKKNRSNSAIASDLAAKIYNLEVLKSNVEDEPGNITRFLIMGIDSKHPEYKDNKKYIHIAYQYGKTVKSDEAYNKCKTKRDIIWEKLSSLSQPNSEVDCRG